MNNINELQNKDSALEKLAAMRCLYSEGKNIFYLRTSVAVLIAVVFPFLKTTYPSLNGWLVAVGIGYLILDIFILAGWESGKRSTAAKVQELFDTEVLGMQWNSIVAENKPDTEIIGRCWAKVVGKGLEKLRDWYPDGISALPQNVAVTLCQRCNIWWDSGLRRLYAHTLVIIVIVLVSSIIWVKKDVSVKELVLFVASFAPLIKLLIEQVISHYKAAKRLDILKGQLDALLENAKSTQSIGAEASITRSVQDEIYRHRKQVSSIPDFFYWIFRKKYENQMGFNAQAFLREYPTTPGTSTVS